MIESIIEIFMHLLTDSEKVRHRKEMPEYERISEEIRGLDPKKIDMLVKICLIATVAIIPAVVIIAIITN